MRERAGETAADLLGRGPARRGRPGRDQHRPVRARASKRTRTARSTSASWSRRWSASPPGSRWRGSCPIVHTITPFLVERPLEQIKLDFGYQGLQGTFVSVGGSYDYTSEGFTHHSPGDVQVMLTVPGHAGAGAGHAGRAGAGCSARRTRTATPRTCGRARRRTASRAAVEVGRLDVVRRGTRATVVAVGPMLDRTLAAVEGMDVTVLYVTTVSPFDADGLAREVADGPDVISVTPFLEGTLTPMLTHGPGRERPRASPRSASGATSSASTERSTIMTTRAAWTSRASANGSRAPSRR